MEQPKQLPLTHNKFIVLYGVFLVFVFYLELMHKSLDGHEFASNHLVNSKMYTCFFLSSFQRHFSKVPVTKPGGHLPETR